MTLISILVSIILIWFDQFTKKIVTDIHNGVTAVYVLGDSFLLDLFGITYVENRGAAFGIMQGGRTFFLIITPIFLAIMIYYYIKLPKDKVNNWVRVSLVLIFAGAIGNFIDRVRDAYVTDFIYFKFIDFPVFNFADVFVVTGTILLGILTLFFIKDEPPEEVINNG